MDREEILGINHLGFTYFNSTLIDSKFTEFFISNNRKKTHT